MFTGSTPPFQKTSASDESDNSSHRKQSIYSSLLFKALNILGSSPSNFKSTTAWVILTVLPTFIPLLLSPNNYNLTKKPLKNSEENKSYIINRNFATTFANYALL